MSMALFRDFGIRRLQIEFDNARNDEGQSGQEATDANSLQGSEQTAFGKERVDGRLKYGHQSQNEKRIHNLKLIR